MNAPLSSGHRPSPIPAHSTQRVRRKLPAEGGGTTGPDWVAVEEPLLLVFAGVRLGMLMRTPGDDHDLGLGFALTEGLVRCSDELARIHHADDDENILVLVPAPGARPNLDLARRGLLTTSSCGICGRLTIAQILEQCRIEPQRQKVGAGLLRSLPDVLCAHQPAFQLSGGHHAAALVAAHGELLAVGEDIGRHNAVDKVIGAAVRRGIVPKEQLLLTTGRCSLEIVQKAAMVGIGTVVGIGAVSSLAIELAKEVGVTLCGFASRGTLSVYVGEEFIDGD